MNRQPYKFFVYNNRTQPCVGYGVILRVISGEVKIIPSKLYGLHQLVDMVQFLITTNMLQLSYSLFLPHFYECGLSIYTNYQMCTFLDNKTGATCGVEFANRAPEATRGLNGDCSAL